MQKDIVITKRLKAEQMEEINKQQGICIFASDNWVSKQTIFDNGEFFAKFFQLEERIEILKEDFDYIAFRIDE